MPLSYIDSSSTIACFAYNVDDALKFLAIASSVEIVVNVELPTIDNSPSTSTFLKVLLPLNTLFPAT